MSNPTQPAANKPPAPVVVYPALLEAYKWMIGLIGLALLVGAVVMDNSVLNYFSPENFFTSDLLFIITLIITGVLCNLLLFNVPPNVYLTLAMLVYHAAFLIYPAFPAALIAAIPAFVTELTQLKRGTSYIARTTGIYVICIFATRYTFEWLGGGPLVGDIGPKYFGIVLVCFVVFRIFNDSMVAFTQQLEGLGFWRSLQARLFSTIITYLAMLPGAMLLAVLKFQTGAVAFFFGCSMAVGIGFILKRSSDVRKSERRRLEEVEQLNARLARQNAQSLTLGNRINETLEGFLSLVRDYAGTSQEQEAAIVEITATVEELTRTAAQIASSADNVASAAEVAIETAERGQSAVGDTIESISEVREKAQEIAARILNLSEKSEKIGEIVTTINAFANEIRLLALNATIEASGAGPFGRRFAVVASEVNALADRSRQAALEIRNIVAEIQSATTSSVRVAEEGLQRMERSVATATQSEIANQEIISQVERTAGAAAAISLATQQQRSASEQVVTSMHNVAIMIGQNAEKVAGVSVASLELQRIARELRSND